jgi:hypothetical protein
MKIKLILICAFVVLGASICFAQAPAKKTDLTVADREALQKVRVHACFDDYSLGITDPMRWHKVKRL